MDGYLGRVRSTAVLQLPEQVRSPSAVSFPRKQVNLGEAGADIRGFFGWGLLPGGPQHR